MKPKFTNLLFAASMVVVFSSTASAADVTKADNSDNLNLGTSWSLGTAPGANDFALWNNTVIGASSTLLGAELTWGGIKITNPAGPVSIGAGNTLTLGAGGIDMSTASQGLTIATLASLSNTAQQWHAGNQVLNITSFTRGSGSTVNLITSGGGTINIASGTASAALGGYAVLNGSDYAALDGSKNVVAATYANYASGGNLSGTYTGILNVTGTTAGATQAWRNSNTLTVSSGVRFGQNNTQNTKWTVDTSSAGRVLTTPSILVGSAVTQNVEFNGSGGVRAAASASELVLQNFGTGSLIFNTTINNPSSGSHSLTKAGSGKVVIASASGYSGDTRINEGTFQLGNGATTGSIGSASIINNGNLAFNRSDTINAGYAISGNGSVSQDGSGTISLTGSNSYTGSTNFNAGTVSFNSLSNFGNGTALNFNGGALSWNGVTTDISTRTVTINAGGATLNTNGNNVSFANSIGNGGSGGLTKAGLGTLTLNGSNYSGTTSVTGGTLVANGSISGGASVGSGSTLGGTGTYGGTITVNNGGIVAPGNSVGTITTAGLTLGAGSILNFEFNNTPANDYINVTGAGGLTINGGGFNLFVEGTTNAFSSAGSYSLIGYSGSIGGTGVSALSVLNPQAGKNYGFSASGSNVVLDITNAGVISDWNADADGSWNTSGNWTGAVPDGSGQTGNFSAALSTARTITLDGTKTLGGISFNGGAGPLGYVIAQGSSGYLAMDNGANQANLIVTTGANTISADVSLDSATAVAAVDAGASLTISGSVGGVGALVKSGGGTLDLTNPSNGYDGDTSIAGGTLGFSALGSLGDGNLLLDGGTLRYNAGNTADISSKTVTIGTNGGTIHTNGNDVTLANAIGNSGTGSLTKSGTGTLTLGGSNTYTGATIVNGGTIAIFSNDNLGPAATGAGLTLNGGSLNNTAAVSLDNAGANARGVTIGASGGTVKTDAALTIPGQVSGSGTLTKTGAGTLQLNGNNGVSFSGSVQISEGTVALGGGQSNGTNGLGSGSIVFQGGTLNLNGYGAADNATSYGTLNNAVHVAAGQSGTLNLPKRVTIGSTLTGSGTLNVKLDGTRDDFQGNWSAFAGQINVNGPGEFRLANFQNNVFNNAKLNLGAGVILHQIFNPPSSGNLTTVQNIGELSGASGSTIGGNPVGGRFVEWSVGSLNTDSTFSGDIVDGSGASKLAKVGTGILTLDGTSTYTGSTTVSAGTLLVNGSLGNTAVTVNNGGKLGGTGGVIGTGTATVTVNSGGSLAPGSSPGTLTINGSTTLNSGATFAFEYTGGGAGAATDLVEVNGTLSINSATLTLVDLGSYTLWDKFTLFSYESLTGTFSGLADDSVFTANGGDWLINYDDATAGLNGGSGANYITITAVPEPGAALLGGLGVLALLRRRRN